MKAYSFPFILLLSDSKSDDNPVSPPFNIELDDITIGDYITVINQSAIPANTFQKQKILRSA
jgi:hypothetical protein